MNRGSTCLFINLNPYLRILSKLVHDMKLVIGHWAFRRNCVITGFAKLSAYNWKKKINKYFELFQISDFVFSNVGSRSAKPAKYPTKVLYLRIFEEPLNHFIENHEIIHLGYHL